MTWRCKNAQVRRDRRRGFAERNVLWLVGLFPWICKECGLRVMRFKRTDEHGIDQSTYLFRARLPLNSVMLA
jgi:hypothetical protein